MGGGDIGGGDDGCCGCDDDGCCEDARGTLGSYSRRVIAVTNGEALGVAFERLLAHRHSTILAQARCETVTGGT